MMVATTAAVLLAPRVRAMLDDLLVPDAPQWARAGALTAALTATPLEAQPSAYVRAAWERRPRGGIRSADLRALATPRVLALRLEWEAPRPHRRITDVNTFADACAVLFPADGHAAPLETMGSERAPVRGWHWQAGAAGPFAITARGLGTVERDAATDLRANAHWEAGRWSVTFAAPAEPEDVGVGRGVPFSVAIWSGAAGERAGLKSHAPEWMTLRVAPSRGGRR